LILLVILLTEWVYAEYSKGQLIKSIFVNDDQSYTDNKLPEFNLFSMPEETYAEMIERPLFVQGRRPLINEEAANINELELTKIDDWVLVGIYSKDNKLNALFSNLDQQQAHQKKIHGEKISGWLIKEIQMDRVVLQKAGDTQILMLRTQKPKFSKKNKLLGPIKKLISKEIKNISPKK